VLNQVMEAEMTEFLQADTYERTDQRTGYRNGSRERDMTCRVGGLTLEVPRDRAGDFSTELFDRLQHNEQALVAALMEIVVNGVSTRRVKNITNELCGTDFAKSTVSDLCKDLDDTVDTWNNRELHRDYPFVLVDAMYIKVRRESGVQPTSLLIAVGVNEDGYREIIGLRVANSESKQSWLEMFRWLKDRGLDGVDLVVSDDHKGLRQAVYRCFQGRARWQRCQEHFKRNLKDKVSASVWSDFKPALDCVFKADSPLKPESSFRNWPTDSKAGPTTPFGRLKRDSRTQLRCWHCLRNTANASALPTSLSGLSRKRDAVRKSTVSSRTPLRPDAYSGLTSRRNTRNGRRATGI
jgi:transposase-like protein